MWTAWGVNRGGGGGQLGLDQRLAHITRWVFSARSQSFTKQLHCTLTLYLQEENRYGTQRFLRGRDTRGLFTRARARQLRNSGIHCQLLGYNLPGHSHRSSERPRRLVYRELDSELNGAGGAESLLALAWAIDRRPWSSRHEQKQAVTDVRDARTVKFVSVHPGDQWSPCRVVHAQ